MKNYKQILSEAGIEIPEDKAEAIEKEIVSNYRTKADYDNVVSKRDELSKSLEGVQGQLDSFKDINVDDLKGQIANLTTQLAEEKIARVKDAENSATERKVDKFLSDKKFVNDITADAIRGKFIAELSKDSAKGVSFDELFKSITTDKDGNEIPNIFKVEEEGKPKAKFTDKPKAGSENIDLTKLSMDEKIKLKRENPALYEQLKRM